MFIQNCLPIPTCKNTPNGGRITAATMRQKSTQLSFHKTQIRYVAHELQVQTEDQSSGPIHELPISGPIHELPRRGLLGNSEEMRAYKEGRGEWYSGP
jgi:hypothetical protein